MYAINTENKEIAKRQRIERAIVRRVVVDALKAGYRLSVDDGGDELAIAHSTSQRAVLAALVNTDDDKLICEREDHRGVVWFVYGGSGWDVICDYSVRLEDMLAGANLLAERLEERN